MKIGDVRNLPDDEIASELRKVREKAFKLKFHAKGAGQENPGVLSQLKRDVARMLTVLRERELAKSRK